MQTFVRPIRSTRRHQEVAQLSGLHVTRLLPLLLTVACSSQGAGGRQVVLRAEPGAVLAPDTSIGSPELLDSLLLFRPWSVRGAGDLLYICDTGNDRVEIVNRQLSRVATFGHKGAGPGEFGHPNHIDVKGTMLAVLDAGNGRVNRYRLDGTYEGEFRLPGTAESFAILDSAHVVIPDPTGDHAFEVIGRTGAATARGHLPPAFTGLGDVFPDARQGFRGLMNFVATSGRSVFVADGYSGIVAEYASSGKLLSAFSLPPAVLSKIFEFERKVARSFHVPAASPVYKDITALPNGTLMLLTSVPGLEVLVLDPAARTYRVLKVPDGAAGAGARSAASATMVWGTFAFVGWNGLSFFRSVGERP